MIIGVQKGGTTSLHKYLLQHPNILGPKEKELHFFDSCKRESIMEYHKNFPFKLISNKVTFESTPRYLYYPNTAEKLLKYNSDLKFIIVLRDPVKRAYSAWNMYMQMLENPRMRHFFLENEKKCAKEQFYTFFIKNNITSFYEWVQFEIDLTQNELSEIIEPSIVRRGYYKSQIKHYFNYFERSQFHFVDSTELLKNTSKELEEICSFLEIKKIDYCELNLDVSHKREYKKSLDVLSKKLLEDHYKVKNKGLEELIGKKMSWIKK
ncbi:sulfotransferase domain-containing protein [Oceanihabitans sediminis]|uniref:sulfotransferase domain-containing protein n=1 Tax=Oceanihabitans sediminis TaxID=1812012 RepID=UPI00299EAE99|nr:sulfotransferase domain-containing protein [Oceanihabitans sediminis]MDX1774896.1 sulfotransferase domain-containing protein [Oceanihabitans sediminis]